MQAQAEALMKFGCGAVLVKGGHASGSEAVDVFFDGTMRHVLRRPRIETREHARHRLHAVGCDRG